MSKRKRPRELRVYFIPPWMTGKQFAALLGRRIKKTEAKKKSQKGLAKRWRKKRVADDD